MKYKLLILFGILLVGILLTTITTCQSTPETFTLQNTGYVLSEGTLTIFDTMNWTKHREISLPKSQAENFNYDSQGRIWIGFSGRFMESDDLVHIYSPQGDLLRALHVCEKPRAGISFARNRAFIVCTLNGFSGKVVVIDLETLDVEQEIEISLAGQKDDSETGDPLLLISSAANEDVLVICGLTSSPDNSNYSVATLIDTTSLEVREQIKLGRDTDIWHIIPYQKSFYLLNVSSWQRSREQANDILILNPENPTTITSKSTAASPLWGTIEHDILYAYHNPYWNQPNNYAQRQISRFDLLTGQLQLWPLPDEWDAGEITIIDGQIILVGLGNAGKNQEGLYCFDPESGTLDQLLNIPGAYRIIVPH